jgi:hypothetical protein
MGDWTQTMFPLSGSNFFSPFSPHFGGWASEIRLSPVETGGQLIPFIGFQHVSSILLRWFIGFRWPILTTLLWPFPSVTPGGILVRWAFRWPFPAAECHATGAGSSMGFFCIFFTWFNHQGWKKMEILNMETSGFWRMEHGIVTRVTRVLWVP